MLMKKFVLTAAAALASFLVSGAPETTKVLHIVTTGDVHGSFFARPYTGTRTKTSLMSVKHYVDSLRQAVGEENVLLLDAGDVLQGDNAAFYFNTLAAEPHIYPRLAAAMGYDAVAVGNHDIEAGHQVYDRVARELQEQGIPFLAANALKPDGTPYFTPCTIVEKAGLKVAVLGYTNANISNWLAPEKWEGITFLPIGDLVQSQVDAIRKAADPDVVVVLAHTGTGVGSDASAESEGETVFDSLRGVQLFVCAHDHRPCVDKREGRALVNGGARAGYVTHSTVTVTARGRRRVGTPQVDAETVRLDKNAVDKDLEERFRPEFEAVKAFTVQPVCRIQSPLETRRAFCGMSDYLNLIHTVQLSVPEAQISFAAPLTYNGRVAAGELVYNDLFTIYPFENQLYMVLMQGSEVVRYLEESYDAWIQDGADHVLRIVNAPDPRTGALRWSFVGRTYNFDSAGGLRYTVDVTRPKGSRVKVESLADGTEFNPDVWYNVMMTSYRVSGGGGLLQKATLQSKEEIEERVMEKYPEIRDIIYDYLQKHPVLEPSAIYNPRVVGSWEFVPSELAAPAIGRDMDLLFPPRH